MPQNSASPANSVYRRLCSANRRANLATMEQADGATTDVRSALRAATGSVHERLHQAPPFAALAREQLDVSGYTRLLRKIAVFHFTVGPELGLDNARRERLARDLEVLGSPVPAPAYWRPPETPAELLGWTYVVEGSTLGGKVLYRKLDYLFGRSENGRCFFKGSAADGARWRTLCNRLEAEASGPGTLDEMIGGATDAFDMFERLLVPGYAHA